MSTSYTDVFTGKNITAAFPQYSAIALTGNITLSWPAQFQNTNEVVSVLMDITPSIDGWNVTMPDAREGSTGFQFTVNNPGIHSFTLKTSTGVTIVTVAAGEASLIWLIDNDAAAGVWRNIPAFGGASAVTFVDASSDSNNLVITGVPITTGGTIAFSIQRDLLALTQFGGSVGYAARTAANTWSVRSFLGTANQILVVNPTGVAANTSFSLAPNISGITSLTLAGLSLGVITASTIATTGANVDLTINPNGIGEIALSKNAKLATNKSLKFIGDNGVNYISFSAGATGVNQTLIWPGTAGGAGQVMINNGAGSLAWGTVPSFPGATTLNAVARYSNVTGSLKDSPNFIVTDAGAITGPISAQIGAIGIATFDSQTISTTGALDLIISPTGDGALRSKGDVIVTSSNTFQRKLRLYNLAADMYAGLQALPGMIASVIWTMPAASAAGIFTADLANQISITPFTSYFPAVSTLNAVPRFSNTTGYPLKNSSLIVNDAAAATGLASCTFGNISVSVTGNTIESTNGNGNINLVPNGIGFVNLSNATASTSTGSGALVTAGGIGVALKAFIGGALNVTDTTDSTTTATGSGIFSGGLGIAKAITGGGNISLINSGTTLELRLYNSAATFYTGFKAGAAAANTTFTLPLAAPASLGIVKSDSSGVMTIDALGAVAGPLRSNSSGVVSVNNITTSPNELAKYSDGVGTFAATGSFLDSNNNLSLGTSSIGGGGATAGLVLNQGSPATSAPGSVLTIGNRSTGSGNVVAFYGAGDGGVSASVTNTVTNKISVYVNGTRFYLLASTSGA